MSVIIPIASGKGGVGKTMFVANLGYALSTLGKTTVLVDLDLGASNLHTYLSVKNNKKGMGSFILGEEEKLENLVIKTSYPKLYLVIGDSLVPGAANISYFKKAEIIEEIKKIEADYVLLDLGAGSSYDVVDFFLLGKFGIVVTIPEITSILNAYSFIKTLLYRNIILSFDQNSKERLYLQNNLIQKIEGTDLNFPSILQGIKEISQDSYRSCIDIIKAQMVNVVINRSEKDQSKLISNNLRKIVRDNLGIEIRQIGNIPYNENIPTAIVKKQLAMEFLEKDFTNSIFDIADKITEIIEN